MARTPVADRLWPRTERDGGHLLWRGALNQTGYGIILDEDFRCQLVHRVAYALYTGGPIPPGMTVDHICRVRNCIAKDHLRLLTMRENASNNAQSMRTHCPKGHRYDKANTYINPRGSRVCRACNRAAARRYHQKQREKEF